MRRGRFFGKIGQRCDDVGPADLVHDVRVQDFLLRGVAFQMAEVAIHLFADNLRLIAELRPPLAASTA
jgi:hypothetical protein